MALLSTDVLLQRLIDESSKGNEHLKSMRELLLAGSSSKTTAANPRANKNAPKKSEFSKALGEVFGEMKGLGQTVLGNNGSVQNTVNALGSSVSSVAGALGNLPGPIGAVSTAFGAVVDISTSLYNSMNEQLNMYNALNSAGLNLSAGMITARKGSASAYMSLNEFSEALTRNSDALAAMDGEYGDGVEHFGRLMESIQQAQNYTSAYGLSQQQLADITARNYKFNKIFGAEQQARRLTETQSTQSLVSNLNYLSKTVGKSVDELLKKFESMTTNVDSAFAMGALRKRFRFGDDQASEILSASNEYFTSMGDSLGSAVQSMNSSKLGLSRLPDEFNNRMLHLYTDELEKIQAQGVTDPKEYSKRMDSFVQRNMQDIQNEMETQLILGNTAAAKVLNDIMMMSKTLNDPKKNPTPYYEDMVTKFNLWIGKEFTKPLNTFYAESKESLAKYLLNLSETTDNAWDFASTALKDGYNKLNDALGGWLNAPVLAFNKLTELFYGEKAPMIKKAFGDLFDSVVEVPKQLIKTIWEWIRGGDISEVSSGLRISMKMFFSEIGESFSNMTKIEIDIKGLREKITQGFENMKNSVFKFWDKLTSWWNTDDTKAIEQRREELKTQRETIAQTASSRPKSAEIKQQSEYTKPEKIDIPEQKQEDIKTISNEEMMRTQREQELNTLVTSMLNTLQNQSQQYQQTIAELRKITENTEPARNV